MSPVASATESTNYRIGVDIGGTFTDLALLGSGGAIATLKVPSTPDDYSRGIIEGFEILLRRAAAGSSEVDDIVHATTVATNTILELKGAKTGLVTTKGFRDVLELRRLRVPQLYDLQYEKPPPLVPRRHRFEVTERLGPNGQVWEPLEETEAVEIAAALKREGVEAVAICLLHAYVNADHEARVAQIVREVVGDDVFVTCATDVLPEIREYERTSTAVVNAYVGPVVSRYMRTLRGRLQQSGLTAPLHVMQSNGGIMTAQAAMEKPAYIVESGPAAGVIAAARLARETGNANAISLDMGGTTAKAALIEDGQPSKTSEYEVGAGINISSRLVKGGGYPIKLPFIDVSEIGAGGGSIIAIDSTGVLKVGPQSAGAVPGPVCYGAGGTVPTLTDALVVLGYLNPAYLVGGALPIDAKASATALSAVAATIDRPLLELAHGAYRIAAATMTRAVKAVSTYQGRDPRDFTLIAFGGNGPVAAAEIAAELEMNRVLVPPAPGVFSALGLLFCEPEREFIQTLFQRGARVAPAEIDAAFRDLEYQGRTALSDEGYDPEDISLRRFADLRYSGQAYELTVPVSDGVPDMDASARSFGEEHLRTYGHRSETDPVDLINVKVLARVRQANGAGSGLRLDQPNGDRKELGTRLAYFGTNWGQIETLVVSRDAVAKKGIEGPAIIEEYDATCVIPPGAQATIDRFGNIDITLQTTE